MKKSASHGIIVFSFLTGCNSAILMNIIINEVYNEAKIIAADRPAKILRSGAS